MRMCMGGWMGVWVHHSLRVCMCAIVCMNNVYFSFWSNNNTQGLP